MNTETKCTCTDPAIACPSCLAGRDANGWPKNWRQRMAPTEIPKARCQFGRPHVWMHGFYEGDEFFTDMVKCATCGQIEED